jgi:two-component system, sensor histidine kinase YesM
MVAMFNYIYNYYLQIKSFNKIFITYAVIIISALLILVSIVSSNMTSMLLSREIKYDSLILQNINHYYEDLSVSSKTSTLQSAQTIPSKLNAFLKKYYEGKYGTIMILKENGSVIFDSSNQYYSKIYPYENYKNGNSTYRIKNKEYLVVTIRNSKAQVLIIGLSPVDEILTDMRTTKSTLFFIALLCILAALALTYFSKAKYIKRVQAITDAMKTVHMGDLSERIPISNSHDEINEIAQSFNTMCDNLENYIDKVYISDIKQKRAELIALQSQINPHFLYNTLEIIRMSAAINGADEAGEMIQILSKLFRNVVQMDTIISVDDEIRNSKLYLNLFKIRYGDKLKFEIDIDPEILNFSMIKHLIQPVIENYIVHGFDNNLETNCVTIKGYQQDGFIYFVIADNAKGIDPITLAELNHSLTNEDYKKRDSIGLKNVNDRIKLIYSKDCGIQVSSIEGKGTQVKIVILAKTKEELLKYVQGIIS